MGADGLFDLSETKTALTSRRLSRPNVRDEMGAREEFFYEKYKSEMDAWDKELNSFAKPSDPINSVTPYIDQLHYHLNMGVRCLDKLNTLVRNYSSACEGTEKSAEANALYEAVADIHRSFGIYGHPQHRYKTSYKQITDACHTISDAEMALRKPWMEYSTYMHDVEELMRQQPASANLSEQLNALEEKAFYAQDEFQTIARDRDAAYGKLTEMCEKIEQGLQLVSAHFEGKEKGDILVDAAASMTKSYVRLSQQQMAELHSIINHHTLPEMPKIIPSNEPELRVKKVAGEASLVSDRGVSIAGGHG